MMIHTCDLITLGMWIWYSTPTDHNYFSYTLWLWLLLCFRTSQYHSNTFWQTLLMSKTSLNTLMCMLSLWLRSLILSTSQWCPLWLQTKQWMPDIINVHQHVWPSLICNPYIKLVSTSILLLFQVLYLILNCLITFFDLSFSLFIHPLLVLISGCIEESYGISEFGIILHIHCISSLLGSLDSSFPWIDKFHVFLLV